MQGRSVADEVTGDQHLVAVLAAAEV